MHCRSVAVEDFALQESMAIAQNQMDTDIQDPVNYIGIQSDTMEKGKNDMLCSSVDLPTTSSSAHQIAVEGLQPQADTCASNQGQHLQNNQFPSSTQSLVPIMTTRFNGKNYHCWRHQMEFFLKQLNVAYVLTDSCPSTIPGEGATTSLEENTQAEVAAKKWVDDEYICRHNILNSLSDNLFEQYSKKKIYNARELWEELKSDYAEEFGTVRSEVNKYIHFEMVDGISVVEQVQELNYIANSITKSGIWIDENLHVSVIISKLPHSWKEYRAKLMYYEFLSVNMLLHLLKLEEESRNQRNKGNPSRMTTQVVENNNNNRYEMKRKEGKRLCYNCNKEGHISRYCPDRKLD